MTGSERPTPAKLAAILQVRQSRESAEAIRKALAATYPEVVWQAQRMGADLEAEISHWMDHDGPDSVADWADNNVTGFQLVRRWAESKGRDTPLLAALVQEERLCRGGAELGPYFRNQGLDLASCLVEARERVALASLDAAFRSSWSKRMVFGHSLEVARTYLSFLMDKAKLELSEPKRFLVARFGISTVLAARFGEVSQEELESACIALRETHENGSDNALSYFVEGCLWRYDLFGDLGALREAASYIHSGSATTNRNPTWYLNCTELWVKLAGEASPSARRQFLLNASRELESAAYGQPGEIEAVLRLVMLTTLVSELRSERMHGENISMRGTRFPFCLRASHAQLPATLELVAPALIKAIATHKSRGSYVFRDVLAELHAYLARKNSGSAVGHLTSAIQLRQGGLKSKPLRGSRVELAQAEDQLLLAKLAGRLSIRREALAYLAKPGQSESDTATRLVVFAQDIEDRGPVAGALLPIEQELALAARNGDATRIYEVAAALAIHSHELQRRRLGGRGSAIMLQDAENSIGRSFVFKQLSTSANEKDRLRTEQLLADVRRLGETHRFGVVDHLTHIRSTVPGLDASNGHIVSVRRFSQGQTLEEAISASPQRAKTLIETAVQFLALFHASGNSEHDGTRRCLWERELGRWLRSMYSTDERAEVFAAWWACVQDAPLLERRDAHALNWLVDASGRMLAVDLDAKGARPLGFELAQLIEDVQYLSPDNWAARKDLLHHYLDALNRYGLTLSITFEKGLEYMAAGIVARAIWLFSSRDATSTMKIRTGRLLDLVAKELPGSRIGELAWRLSTRWTEIAGVTSEIKELGLTAPERRRISRAMAFHLRHDPTTPASREGWVHVEELAELLNKAGHKVSPDALLLIAGAAGEPRFEREGSDIRAAYGHSLKMSIAYEKKLPPKWLYHATPLENLRSIFEARAGLRRGKRQWVHLSDRPSIAMNASTRQHKPVALLRISAPGVDNLVYASGNTWLAPLVPSDVLEIVPLRDVRELLNSDTAER